MIGNSYTPVGKRDADLKKRNERLKKSRLEKSTLLKYFQFPLEQMTSIIFDGDAMDPETAALRIEPKSNEITAGIILYPAQGSW
jgi:hypothetical protein